MAELTDAGARHDVRRGETVTVCLPENPTTGFIWQASQTGNGALQLVDDTFEAAGGLPGAAGVRVFKFVASAAGALQLAFAKRRPWESAEQERQEFTLIIS